MKPVLLTLWSAGEDFGVRQDVLDEVAGEAGLRSTIEAALRLVPDLQESLRRIRAGFAVTLDVVVGLVGGYGLAHAAIVAARRPGASG
jgi:glutamate dehydrogenase (NAD(P)+)